MFNKFKNAGIPEAILGAVGDFVGSLANNYEQLVKGFGKLPMGQMQDLELAVDFGKHGVYKFNAHDCFGRTAVEVIPPLELRAKYGITPDGVVEMPGIEIVTIMFDRH